MTARPGTLGHFQRMLHLRKTPVLGTLAPPLLSAFAEVARERHLARGTVLQTEGEPPSSAYSIVEGSVEVSRRGEVVERLGAGCELGGLRLLARDVEGLHAVAVADTLALEVEGEALFELFDDEFPILHHVIRELCRQLVNAQKVAPRWPPAAPPDDAFSGEMDLVERILYLRRVPTFGGASINALAELSRGLVDVRFDAGATLWEAGHSSDWALLVVDGTVRCTLLRGPEFLAGPSAPLGALEAVGEVPRWYTAVTVTPVRGLQGNIEGLIDLFEDNVDMALEYLAFLARLLLGGPEAASR